ncbi:MAG: putative lipoprotein [Proteobacteria bacterium]|nr:putative lipoprotein [Pseudomonadota bacterium]
MPIDANGHAPCPPRPADHADRLQRVAGAAPTTRLSDQIRYRFAFDDPTRVRYYSLDRWLAPPPSLLSQRLASGIAADGQLHVRLLDFEQIFDAPRTARVIMRFRASLKADGIGTTEQEFRLSHLCPTPDAKGAVTAFAVLVDDSVDKIRDWVGRQRAFSSGPFRTAP